LKQRLSDKQLRLSAPEFFCSPKVNQMEVFLGYPDHPDSLVQLNNNRKVSHRQAFTISEAITRRYKKRKQKTSTTTTTEAEEKDGVDDSSAEACSNDEMAAPHAKRPKSKETRLGERVLLLEDTLLLMQAELGQFRRKLSPLVCHTVDCRHLGKKHHHPCWWDCSVYFCADCLVSRAAKEAHRTECPNAPI